MEKPIEFFKLEDRAEGKAFAVTKFHELIATDDIFIPSLRNFHVIFWIRKGEGKYMLDFQEFDFHPNQLIFLSKNQLHCFLPFDKEKTEVVSIVFTPDFIYKTANDLKRLFNFNVNQHNQRQTNTLDITDSDITKLNLIYSQAYQTYHSHSPYKETEFYHWLCLFLIHCERLQEQKEQDHNKLADTSNAIWHFNDLLETHFKEEFGVAFYADKLHISVKSLARLTQKHYKTSPKAIIDERRILEIKRMLKGTDKSGKAIALEMGFDEPTNMFKYFKKHVGITPNEFRGNQ